MKNILFTFILLFLSTTVLPQSDDDDLFLDEITVAGSGSVEKVDANVISAIVDGVDIYLDLDLDDDPQLKQALRNMLITAAIHETKKSKVVKDALVVQKAAAYTAFIVAHILLFVGIFIGIFEYRRIVNIKKRGEEVEDIEISIGIESIALKATMGATLALVFCFGFYTLYLVYVFPVESL